MPGGGAPVGQVVEAPRKAVGGRLARPCRGMHILVPRQVAVPAPAPALHLRHLLSWTQHGRSVSNRLPIGLFSGRLLLILAEIRSSLGPRNERGCPRERKDCQALRRHG